MHAIRLSLLLAAVGILLVCASCEDQNSSQAGVSQQGQEAEQGTSQLTAKAHKPMDCTPLDLKAPSFALRDLAGKEVKLDEVLKEKPALLVFWATWCEICVGEIPELIELQKEHGQELSVLAINIKEAGQKVAAFARSTGINYSVLLDSDARVASDYRVYGIPTLILIGKDRNVHYSGHDAAAAREKLHCVYEGAEVRKVYGAE